MQHDWFMYHLRSTYKNRLDFPFININAHTIHSHRRSVEDQSSYSKNFAPFWQSSFEKNWS